MKKKQKRTYTKKPCKEVVVKKTEEEYNREVVANVVCKGDLSGLNDQELVVYYIDYCKALGLNPVTQPFDIIETDDKKTGKKKKKLYANANCAAQLRDRRGVEIYDKKIEKIGTLYTVTVYARDKYGRMDTGMGVVDISTLSGEYLANAFMKAETKAKRRASLSLCGIGSGDETDIETIPHSKIVVKEIPQKKPVLLKRVEEEKEPEEDPTFDAEKLKLNNVLAEMEREKIFLSDAETRQVNNIVIDMDMGARGEEIIKRLKIATGYFSDIIAKTKGAKK